MHRYCCGRLDVTLELSTIKLLNSM